jgi:hypothetical protein
VPDELTIADLPGISDIEQVKVNVCMDHLLPATISGSLFHSRVRLTTPLLTLVARFQECFKHKMAVICARSDDDITKPLVLELVIK